nr:reverse transcriptase domain-containing protein [Tanacetum cinerariifolium]
MDGESSCEIIYESCFEKLNPTIKATKVDLKTPLAGFSREHSWSIGEVPLEITMGDAPFLRTKTLNFVIVRSDFPYNMLLGRTTMQRMGIVVSTIHGAIKFHKEKGIGTVLSIDKANKGMKRAKRIPSTRKERVLRAPYQSLVDNVFRHQIRRDLEAYVDEMVIKITSEIEMLKDIQETFEREEKETPTNFLVEIPSEDNERKEKPKEVPNSSSKWRLYTDGPSNSDGSEVGNQNKKADALSKLALMTFEHLTKEVLVKFLTKKSIEEKEVLEVETQERKSWMDPIREYLLSGLFPEDTREARKIRIQAPQYKLI